MLKKAFDFLFYILFFFGFLISIPSFFQIGIFCSFFLFILFIKKVYRKFGVFSLSFLFLFFFGLYSYSIPLSIIGGLDIGEYRLDYISTWDQIDDTLISFSLINHIALVGMIIAYVISLKKKQANKDTYSSGENTRKSLFSLSLILGVFSSLFEFINFLRVGGLSTLFSGKLIYQSSQADAGMLLPSEIFFYMAIASFAYTCSSNLLNKRKVSLFIFVLSFYIIVNLIIGERGVFVNGLVMFFLGYNFYSILFRVKHVYIVVGLVVYFAFAIITVYRSVFDAGLDVSASDAVGYVSEREDVLIFVLNPANSEFCTSALNYRVFLNRHRDELVNYKYGLSYLHFYSQLLPQKINPLYDVSETIKFRDKYFPERAKGGSTGGTAYSSMYEAYVNWWYFGGAIVYFVVFYMILFCERLRFRRSSLYIFFVYILSFELVLLFNRSAFEYIVVKLIAILFYSFLAIKINSFSQFIKQKLV